MMENYQILELVQSCLFVVALGVVAFSPIARAIGRRIMHGKTLPPDAVIESPRMEDLSGEVAALRQALYEQQERLDFAERVIAQQKQREALPGGH